MARFKKEAAFLLWGVASIVLFCLLAGTIRFWDSSGPVISPAASRSLLFLSLLAILSVLLLGKELRSSPLSVTAWGVGLIALFLSDWLCRPYSMFKGPEIRGEILLIAILIGCSPTWVLKRVAPFALPAALLMFSAAFLVQSSARIISSDDHTSFFFRLTLLKENFPFIPFFHPLWNGGIDARDFFATGVLNVYLLFLPIIELIPLASIYNLLVVAILFIVLPLSVYFAARIEELKSPTASLAALLATCSSLLWYRWALKYGTLGFTLSAALVPLVLALTSMVLRNDGKIRNRYVFLLVLASTLMLLWSASGFVLIPAMCFGLISARTLLKRREVRILILAILCINLPWITLFWSVSQVGTFLNTTQPSYQAVHENYSANVNTVEDVASRVSNSKGTLRVIRETAVSTNPLILLLTLPGLLMFKGLQRKLWVANSIWLLFLGSIVAHYKPQLELERFLVILSLTAAIPVALALSELSAVFAQGGWRQRLMPAFVAGFLGAGIFAVAGILRNRSIEQYYFDDGSIAAVSEAINQHGGSGRVLFSGFNLHDLSNGHLAPLSVLTNKPLMASTYVHNLWRYRQIIPKSFMSRGDSGIREYLDLYNVTAVFAHEPGWKSYFEDRPSEYHFVGKFGKFYMFQRTVDAPSYFLSGAGEIVSQDYKSVTMHLKSAQVVVKFNYFPFLECSGCTLTEEVVSPEVSLVRLSGCVPDHSVTLKAVSPLKRLLM